MDSLTANEFQMLSRAVVLWYRYYGVRPVLGRSDTLCREAVTLFEQGLTTSEEIAASLIEKYPADENQHGGSRVYTKH